MKKKKYKETIIAKKKKKNPLPMKSERKQAKHARVGSEFPEFAPPPPFPQVFSLEELAINLEHTSRVAPSGAYLLFPEKGSSPSLHNTPESCLI